MVKTTRIFLIMLQNHQQMHLKRAEVTGDFIGNKIAHKITKASRGLPQNSSETIESETEKIGFHREIPKERYKSQEKRE